MSLLIVRLVVFILLFWAGFRLWQLWQSKQNASKNSSSKNNPSTASEDSSETMVRCEECKVHLPKGSAIKAGEQYFCCPEHQASFKKE